MKPKPSNPAPKSAIERDLAAMFPEAQVARALGKAVDAPVEAAARSSALDSAGVELGDVGAKLRWVREDRCDDNPHQTRADYDAEGHVEGIAESFERVGQLQPGIARPHSDKAKREAGWVQLAAGHSRLRAVRAGGNAGANLPDPERFIGHILLLVRPLNDIEMAVIAIEENEARKKPRVIERARGYLRLKTLLDEAGQGGTWAEYAGSKGITYRRLRQLADLLQLDAPVQKAINEGTWNEKHGRALLSLQEQPDQQKALLRHISDESLSGSGAIKRAGELKAAFPTQKTLEMQENSKRAGQEHLQREAERAREQNRAEVAAGTSPLHIVRSGGGGEGGGYKGLHAGAEPNQAPSQETPSDSAQLEAAKTQFEKPSAMKRIQSAHAKIDAAYHELRAVDFGGRLQSGERYAIDFALRDARALMAELKKLEDQITVMERNDARE